VDDHLQRYLQEKTRLIDTMRKQVFCEEADTASAQTEVLDLLVDHLPVRFPDIYQVEGSRMNIFGDKRSVDLSDENVPALIRAAMMVQEDLVIMRRDDSGWRLIAGCVCFPTSWNLREKFGKPLQNVHAPVPQFGPGSRNAHMIERIFDNLKTDQPVKRMNWSIYSDDLLFHGERAQEHLIKSTKAMSVANSFFRVELQTLTKLETSGDVLFTIRIHVDPMSVLRSLRDRTAICHQLVASLEELDPDQLDYKGMKEMRDDLVGELKTIAGEHEVI